jgi:hypothetical protein
MLMEDPAATALMICQKVPAEDGESLVRGFVKHSAQSFANELTYAGYKDVSVSYLFCEEDIAGPPDFQREMIAMIEEASGRKVDITSIDADHCPNWSAQNECIAWALDVARKPESTEQTA